MDPLTIGVLAASVLVARRGKPGRAQGLERLARIQDGSS